MVSFYKKILILLWKCQLLRRRSYIITLLELVIPLAIFYLLSRLKLSSSLPREHNKSGSTQEMFFTLLYYWDLAYAPSNNVSDRIMRNVVKNIERTTPYAIIRTKAKQREEDFDGWLKGIKYNDTPNFLPPNPPMGILFSDIDSTNNRYIYTIRTNDENMITNKPYDEKMSPLVYSETSMFLGTQVFMEQEFLKFAGVEGKKTWNFGTLPSPMKNVSAMSRLIFIVLIFAYVFVVVSVVKDVVDEKECGTKELMKIMGVDSWMIWAHWFVYTMLIQIPVVIGCTIILAVLEPAWIKAGALIIFLLFLLFTINITVLLFAVSCVFYKTSVAITICLLCWLILNLLLWYLIRNPGEVNITFQLLLTLLPLVNLNWSLNSLLSFDLHGVQWTWSYVFTKGFTEFEISVGVSIIMFFISTMLFLIILVVFDAILPGPFGVAKPFNFICKWFSNCFNTKKPPSNLDIQREFEENFEAVGESTEVGIMLRGLQKIYGFQNKVVAVEKVDLDIYKGEIMALLGHNGAGKTTTMSMITGMSAPTSGIIMFEGQDVTFNKGIFRTNLGFCPQHDLYFTKLTVIEHLMFFGMLKGLTYSDSKESGKRLLDRLAMLNKANTRGSKLSGGMKRRLCLAVSLVGNPKVLILDEPTSGLDPETRRLVWDIILGMRGERTVLITTHFMEEADVLGDRIAIMDQGRVVCCGTSMFLKTLFGAGYQVHVLKKSEVTVKVISSVIHQKIPQAHVRVISNNQVDYIIKQEHVDKFPELFYALESQKSELGITGITVTCATMEDVFLKVANIKIKDTSNLSSKSRSLSTSVDINEFEKLKNWELFFQRVNALFAKRIIFRLRYITSIIIKTAILMICILYFAVYLQFERKVFVEQNKLKINLDLYPDTTVLLAYDQESKGIRDVLQKVSGAIKTFSNISDLEEYLNKESTENSYDYIKKILFALVFTKEEVYVRFHEGINVHSPAIAINFLSNLILHNKTNGTGIIEVINHPFSHYQTEGSCDEDFKSPFMRDTTMVYPYLFIFSLGFIIIFGDLLLFITQDRMTGFKHQQFLAGASVPVYWFVNLIFDFCVYFIITLILLMAFSIFGPKTTLTHITWFGLLLFVFFFQGLSGISFTYMFTFLFDHYGTSLTMYIVLMVFSGMFPALLVGSGVLLLLKLVSFGNHLLIESLLSLNPVFAATMCLRYLIRAIVFEEYCRVCQDEECMTDFYDVLKMPTEDDYQGILLYLIFLVLTSIIYPLLVLIIDSGLCVRILYSLKNSEPDFSCPPDTDDDVKLEMTRVEALKDEDVEMPLRVESLQKKYMCGPKAVDKVSFVVMEGDCFGLLGVNGAGKSTTFKMLTTEILPDRGDAVIYSYSLKGDRKYYTSSVGYCPQFDPILPVLTSKETLSIIAKIRGVPFEEVDNVVTQWLDWMGILQYGEKRCNTYSGGTKRKLSTAMALIGKPEVVFLDEPTTGVDPASKRMLWTVIKEMQRKGQSVVLTSHSMEECEFLCSRLSIMVAGKMKCIGSVEYLKTKFGEGFTVLLKLINATPEEVTNLKQKFDIAFPNNYIKDEHSILIHYTIPNANMSLSRIFSNLLKFKNDHRILEDFTVYNTTLEELFLSFATNTQRRKVE